jgi:hypothetical protein
MARVNYNSFPLNSIRIIYNLYSYVNASKSCFINFFHGNNSHPSLLDLEMALRAGFTVPGFIALKCSTIARETSLIIVSKQENADFIRNAGMIPASSAEEAMAIAREKLGREDYTIIVMGHAANTVPVLGR